MSHHPFLEYDLIWFKSEKQLSPMLFHFLWLNRSRVGLSSDITYLSWYLQWSSGVYNANTNDNATTPSNSIPRQDEETGIEPFPSLDGPVVQSPSSSPTVQIETKESIRSRGQSNTLRDIRRLSKVFVKYNPPSGFCIASGQIASQVPSITDIRRGSFGLEGWSG